MLTNDQMKPGRFAKLANGRRLYRRMNACWDRGGLVRILGGSGSLYAKRGKRLDRLEALHSGDGDPTGSNDRPGSEQQFFEWYCRLHRERFGVEFEPNKDNPTW